MRPSDFTRPDRPVVIAHRGGSLEAPENSLAAFRGAIAAGTDWQELDVSLSLDESVMVLHDDYLERVAGHPGRVAEMTRAQLQQVSIGRPSWAPNGLAFLRLLGMEPVDFADTFSQECVPTLAEVLALAGGRLMIELKPPAPEGRSILARRVVEEITRAGASSRVILASFDPELLRATRQLAQLPLMGLVEEVHEIVEHLRLPISVLGARIDLVSEAVAAALSVPVWAWTMYTAEMAAAALEQGARGLITDAPTAIIDWISRRRT